MALDALHQPSSFLQPTSALYSSFLQLAKKYLDPLASNVTDAQDVRQKEERLKRKRKRRPSDGGSEEMLKMRRVHVDGFDVSQVWQQARRVLEATADEVERDLPVYEEDVEDGGLKLTNGDHSVEEVRLDETEPEAGNADNSETDDADSDLGEEGVDWQYEADDIEDGMEDEDNDGALSDEGSLDIGDETPPSELSEGEEKAGRPKETLVKDKFGLNDGFFSIDDFNKQSQFMEQADVKGEDDGAASDEEDIDWAMDPMMGEPQPTRKQAQQLPRSGSRKNEDVDQEDEADDDDNTDEDDDGDGPTFGNMDLNAPEGESDVEDEDDLDQDMEGMNGISNTNDIQYADFFAPPAQAAGKKKKPRRSKLAPSFEERTNDLAREEDDDQVRDGDMQRAISSVHRDLFDDELSEGDDPDADRDPQDAPAKQNLSSHERRQLALRAEIRRLEAANVAPKDWSLTGETLAPARPMNSLLEEDLDFERAGKPVPVVTDAVNEDIEALIKRRILNREFDEVVRRRPTDLVTGQQKRRGLAELSDTKATKGLAEEYEDEHLRKTDPNYVDQRSEALKAKHADIENHYAAICRDLDILSNLHYKPKPASSSMDVRVDVPKIAMEEARPSVAGAGVEDSVLAPQEVYKAGEERQKGEVMTKGALAISKEEQSREQKKRQRQREKARAKKAAANAPPAANGTGIKEGPRKDGKVKKQDVVRQLGKGGVKVIDKKGDLRDVEGRTVQEQTARAGGGKYRL